MTSIYNQTIKLLGSHPEPSLGTYREPHGIRGRQWDCDDNAGRLFAMDDDNADGRARNPCFHLPADS
jgi:hypothetical protein